MDTYFKGLGDHHLIRRLAVIGFQKCGTTAFIREAKKLDFVHVLTNTNGSTEVTWPLIKELEKTPPHIEGHKRLIVHKFAAYHGIPSAIDYLVESDPTRLLLIFIRDPLKILISWWNYHKSFAINGSKFFPQHFAIIEKDFYSSCSVDEYYKRRRNAFRHDIVLQDLIRRVPSERLMVVSQERLARDSSQVVNSIIQRSLGVCVDNQGEKLQPILNHSGFADKSSEIVDGEIVSSLSLMYDRMNQVVSDSDVFHLL